MKRSASAAPFFAVNAPETTCRYCCPVHFWGWGRTGDCNLYPAGHSRRRPGYFAVLVRESWLTANQNLLPDDTANDLARSADIGGFVAGEWHCIWVVEMDGEMTGVVGVNPAGVIWMLYVRPGY